MARHWYSSLGATALAVVLPAILAANKPQPLTPGLIATCTGNGRTVTRITTTPDFTLADRESIDPRLAPEFTLAYDGVLRILAEGDYTFSTSGAGNAAIHIDGHAAGSVHLTAGDHAIHVGYARQTGPARLQLLWSSTKFPPEPIPPAILGHLTAPGEAVTRSETVERGRLLVQDLNCVACHRDPAGMLHGRPAPDLSTIGSRAKPHWIEKWLENPRHFRPTALMPTLLRDAGERLDVTTFLATLKDPKADARDLSPTPELAKEGRETFESIGCASCHNQSGTSLNGQASKWSSAAALSHFLVDPLAVDPSGRMPSLMLDGKQADAIAVFLLHPQESPTKSAGAGSYDITADLDEFDGTFTAGDAARGRMIFTTAGCLSCHTAAGIAATSKPASDLADLDPATGCLAAEPPPGTPDYHLDPTDRAALAAYLQSIKTQPELSPAPTLAYEEHLRQFNCIACHATGSTGAAKGIDGVPPLSIAGQKLRPEWVRAVLLDKQRVRPWLRLRMPHFGPAVEPLAAELVAVSGAGAVTDMPAPSAGQIAAGRRIVGKGAPESLSCITCHAFDNVPAPAPEQSRGPDLTLMAKRLRPDWFRRWVRDPSRIIPNTVMPSFFTGKSASEVDPVLDRVWDYFSLGRAMPVPDGLDAEKNQRFYLVPTNGPLVQRCYLEGGGQLDRYPVIPRAIAVGLPEFLSYAFDPESCQLRYAWSGGFVDMTGGWTGRGDTHGRRLGRPFYTAPPGPPIYLDATGTAPAYHYTGYALTRGRVEILYTVDGVAVREWMTPTADGRGAIRTFALDPAGHELFLVVADDPSVRIHPIEGRFEALAAPAGWDANLKTKVLRATGSGTSRFGYTITPAGGSR